MPRLSAFGGVVDAGADTAIFTPEEFWPPATATTVGALTAPPPVTPPVPPEVLLEELPPPQPTAKQRGASKQQSTLEDMGILVDEKFDALMLGRVGLP